MGDSDDNLGHPHPSHSKFADRMNPEWPKLVELSDRYRTATDPDLRAQIVVDIVLQHTKMGQMTHEAITTGEAQADPEKWMQLNPCDDLTLRVTARKAELIVRLLKHQYKEHAKLNPILDLTKTDITNVDEYLQLRAATGNICLERMRMEPVGGYSAYAVQAEFNVDGISLPGSVDLRFESLAEEVGEVDQKDKFVINVPLMTIHEILEPDDRKDDRDDDRETLTPHGPSEGVGAFDEYYDQNVYKNVAQTNKINQAQYLAIHMVEVVLEKGREDITCVLEHVIERYENDAGKIRSDNDERYVKTILDHLNALSEFMHAADDDNTGLAYQMRHVHKVEAYQELLYECPEDLDQQVMLDNILKNFFVLIAKFGDMNKVVYCNNYCPYIPKGSTNKEYRVEIKAYFGPCKKREPYKDEHDFMMRAPVMLPIKTRTESGEVLPLMPPPFGIVHSPEYYLYNEWGYKTVDRKKTDDPILTTKSFFLLCKANDKNGKDVGMSHKQQYDSAVVKKRKEDKAELEKANAKDRKAKPEKANANAKDRKADKKKRKADSSSSSSSEED